MGFTRWAASVGAVATISLGMVVAVPSGAAQALDTVPSPVKFLPIPTTTGDNPVTWTPDEWNRYLQQNPDKVPGNASPGAGANRPGVRARTPGGPVDATLLIGSFVVGTQIGTGIANVIGVDTSGDFWCDLSTAFLSSQCGLGASPEYVPNSDIVSTFGGWAVGPHLRGGPFIGAVADAAPGYGLVQSVQSFGVDAGYSGPTVAGSREHFDGVWRAVGRNVNGTEGVIASKSGGLVYCRPGTLGNPCNTAVTWTFPVGTFFDHIEFWIGNSSDVPAPQLGMPSYAGQADALWYPQGHPHRPPEVEANPERWYTTSWQCSTGPAGSASSPVFRETDAEWPGFPQAQCVTSGASVVRLHVQLHTTGKDAIDVVIWEAPAPGGHPSPTPGDCAGGGCQLLLWRYSSAESQINCFNNPAACLDWALDPQKAEKYKCTYGPSKTFKVAEEVDLEQCNVYVGTFPGPGTTRPPEYCAPSGECPSKPPPTPGPGDPPRDDDCPPPFTGLSLFNPWWYYKAGVCVAKWAFVPRGAVVATAAAAVSTAFDASAVGDVEGAWQGLSNLDLSGTCGVLASSDVQAFGGRTLEVNTCGPPWNSFGPIRTLMGIGMLIFATWTSIRMILRSFGIAAAEAGDTAIKSVD